MATDRAHDPSPAMRRMPLQARSAERVQLLLDTTAELVDELGLDGVTTGLVAERAGVSIGSVYRFFPDRRALLSALSSRHLERFLARVAGTLAAGAYPRWWDAIDATIDHFVEMHRSEPGFGPLRFGDAVDERLIAGDATNNDVLVGGFRGLLTHQYGIAEDPDLTLWIEVATEICDHVLKRAFRDDPHGDPRFVAECKAVVWGYLDERMTLAQGV